MSDDTSPKAWDPKAMESVVSRGYQRRYRQVTVGHIQHLVSQAHHLVKLVDSRVFPEPAPGGEVEGSAYTERSLERAVNLLRHAAAELDDERLRLRDGWPQ